MEEITLQQLQHQIDDLYNALEQLRADNETDHGDIGEQILAQTENNMNIITRINSLDNKIKGAESNISSITSEIHNISENTDNISILRQELDGIKNDLSSENLPGVQARLTELNSKIEAVKANWVTKTAFETFVTDTNNRLNEKASDSALKTIENKVTILENKAKVDVVAEVENIKRNLSNINGSIDKIESDIVYNHNSIDTNKTLLNELMLNIQREITDINLKCEEIENGVHSNDRKIVETNRRISDINCDLNELRLKFNRLISQLNEVQVIINNSISSLEEKHNKDIQDVVTSTDRKIQAAIRDHNSYMAGHTREFDELKNRLNNIDGNNGSLNSIRELAQKKWITVLSPEEYKKLPAVSKKQDQLYMCIKYGKPYALYIGSVLIAQRNTTKDSGFVYSFPLSF